LLLMSHLPCPTIYHSHPRRQEESLQFVWEIVEKIVQKRAFLEFAV
jgi:hypothetical protein